MNKIASIDAIKNKAKENSISINDKFESYEPSYHPTKSKIFNEIGDLIETINGYVDNRLIPLDKIVFTHNEPDKKIFVYVYNDTGASIIEPIFNIEMYGFDTEAESFKKFLHHEVPNIDVDNSLGYESTWDSSYILPSFDYDNDDDTDISSLDNTGYVNISVKDDYVNNILYNVSINNDINDGYDSGVKGATGDSSFNYTNGIPTSITLYVTNSSSNDQKVKHTIYTTVYANRNIIDTLTVKLKNKDGSHSPSYTISVNLIGGAGGTGEESKTDTKTYYLNKNDTYNITIESQNNLSIGFDSSDIDTSNESSTYININYV